MRQKGQCAMFDRFGGAPPSFVMQPDDEGLVERKAIVIGDRTGTHPFLTAADRAKYEEDNGGPHPPPRMGDSAVSRGLAH